MLELVLNFEQVNTYFSIELAESILPLGYSSLEEQVYTISIHLISGLLSNAGAWIGNLSCLTQYRRVIH